jgi:putative ABC transport system permease protein
VKGEIVQTIFQDLRYGVRLLLRRPAFTLIAIVTIALGIGANTAIFSLVSAVLLRPLPYEEPERLVMVWEDASFIGFPENSPAPANYADWKAQNSVFEDIAAYGHAGFDLTSDGEPEKVSGNAVSASFFPLLGVKPQLGRTFLPEDEKPGATKVVVLAHRLWESRFGGDSGIIGRSILLDNESYTVIGVMPANFQHGPTYLRLWVPMALTPEELADRDNHYLEVIARMKPGVTVEQADSEIKTIMAGIARDYPEDAGQLGAYVKPLRSQLTGQVRLPLILLMAAVGLVLLISCANVAGLLLARAAARSKEIAVRAALGAGRLRIVRQLVTESLVLASMGGLLSLLVAAYSFEFLRQFIPPEMSLLTSLKMDARVLVFTLLISLVTGVVFGLTPALQAAKVDLNEALKQGGGRSGFAKGQRRMRSALVVAEVAIALVLLVGAGLLIQTLYELQGQYSVMHPDQVLTIRTALSDPKARDHTRRSVFFDRVLERVQSLPGVVAAGYTTSVPLAWKGGSNGITIEGRQREPGVVLDAVHRQISSDYFKTMGVELRAGRYFTDRDDAKSMPVAVVNETMARLYWPGEDALGKRFSFGGSGPESPLRTIVGIVADVRQMGVDMPVKAEMYFPYWQVKTHRWYAPRDLAIRASVDPKSLVPAVSQAIHDVDPTQPVSSVATLAEVLGEDTKARQMGMTLLTAFASLALLLASLGIYGVLSFFVTQHAPEIGVRLALGAQRSDVMGLVLKRGMKLALLGIVIGAAGALVLTRLIRALLFGVTATDPLSFVAGALILLSVALLACWVPARRAAKVDPMIAMRYE